LIKEINKIEVFGYLIMILALLLGVYAQDISYYMSENTVELLPSYFLRIITITSILLFIIPPILIVKLNKKRNIGKEGFTLYFLINFLIGIPTSMWSLLVFIMWH